MIAYASIKYDFVCPRTGRVAVSLSKFATSEFNGQTNSYFYSQASEEIGFDPWTTIDSIDVPNEGNSFDVWLSDGSCKKNVLGDAVIFVRASVAQTLMEVGVNRRIQGGFHYEEVFTDSGLSLT